VTAARLNWIVALFLIAVAALLFRHFFATAWSNKCDPGNAQFHLLRQDPVVSFQPADASFTWENDGPDNSWLCANANLSVSHVGANIKSIYDATRANMTANGWVDVGQAPASDFAVFEKAVDGVKLTAIVSKEAFWVQVDLSAPGLHPGEYGFGG
jgi:uncharacterized membrane protein